MKTWNLTSFLLLLSFASSGNALKCYFQYGDGEREERTVQDFTGADTAHGWCYHTRYEAADEKNDIRSGIGWPEELNDYYRKCYKRVGIEAGKCIEGTLPGVACIEGSSSVLKTSRKALQDPKVTTCFCDKDLCNDELNGEVPTTTQSNDDDNNSGAATLAGLVSSGFILALLLTFELS